MRAWPVLVAAACVLLVVPAARAQSVHEVQLGGDAVSGTISDASDVDRIPIRLPQGAVFSLSLKAAKGSLLHPTLTLLGVDREADGDAMDLLVTASKGNAVSLKNYPVAESGLRWLEIRGADGTTGGWTLTTKAKLPKKAALLGTTSDGTAEFTLVSPGNCTANIAVAGAKGTPVVPELESVRNPVGATVLADLVQPTATGFSLANFTMGLSGPWVFGISAPEDGGFTVKASFKVAKPVKRALTETQIIVDPVLDSISPDSGDSSQVLAVTMVVDFAEAGCQVIFRRSPTVVTLSGSQLTLGDGSVDFSLILASFPKGTYAVEIVNADGGKDSLADALTVENAHPHPTAISPDSGLDNQVVTVDISGTFFLGGMTANLVRGAETIAGTGISGSSGLVQATFDLRGHSHGFYDLVVANPGTPPETLPGAFEVINAPPTVTSMSPGTDLADATFTASIGGTDFDATPTALLRLAGQPDITGTGVVRVNENLVRADFDTTGAVVGARDLVLTNPDLQSSTLADALWVGGVGGPAANPVTVSGTLDGPPSVVHNPVRDEYAAAWVEGSGGYYDVFVQRFSASGAALGSKVTVTTSATNIPKRDAVIGWCSGSNEYLVCWSEIRSSFYQVVVRRHAASNLAPLAAEVLITTHVQVSSWYIDVYHNFRPSICWNASAALWEVFWMQEWSLSGDDYDVLRRSYNPANDALGTAIGVQTSSYHDAEPCVIYDAARSQVLLAYSKRPTNSNPSQIYLGAGTAGTLTITSTSDDLVDPAMALDATNSRILITWTRRSSTGVRSVEGVLCSATSLGTLIGSPAAIGQTGDDDFFARPAWSAALGEAVVAWTRIDATPALSAMARRVDTTGSSDIGFFANEAPLDAGSGLEGTPVPVVRGASAEWAAFWFGKLSLSSSGSYVNSVVAGTYQGQELWMQRHR